MNRVLARPAERRGCLRLPRSKAVASVTIIGIIFVSSLSFPQVGASFGGGVELHLAQEHRASIRSSTDSATPAPTPVPFWSPIYPSNQPTYPLPQLDYAGGFVYDPADGYDVLLAFGLPASLGITVTATAQTWSYSGGVWTNLTATTTGEPPCCAAAPLIFDIADQVVVFVTNAGGPVNSPTQTWTYSHGAWRESSAVGPPSKGTNGYPQYDFAYDATDGYAVLLGGGATYGNCEPDGICALRNYTWTYRSGIWTNVTLTLPLSPPIVPCSVSYPGGSCGAITYDASDRAVILFGAGSNVYRANETWEFTGGRWANMTSSAGPAPQVQLTPTEQFRPMFVYDSSTNQSILLGKACLTSYAPAGESCGPGPWTWAFQSGHWISLQSTFLEPSCDGSAIPGSTLSVPEFVTFDGNVGHPVFLPLGECGTFALWQFRVAVVPSGPSITSFTASPSLALEGATVAFHVSATGGIGQLAYTYRLSPTPSPPWYCPEYGPTFSCTANSTGSFTASVNASDLAGRFVTAQVSFTILSWEQIAIIVLSVGVAVLAAVMAVRFFRHRRRRPPKTPNPPSGETRAGETASASGTNRENVDPNSGPDRNC